MFLKINSKEHLAMNIEKLFLQINFLLLFFMFDLSLRIQRSVNLIQEQFIDLINIKTNLNTVLQFNIYRTYYL